MAKILLISPDGHVHEALGHLIRERGHQLDAETNLTATRPGRLDQYWDAAFLDLSGAGDRGLATVRLTRHRNPSVPITVIDAGGESQGFDRLARAVELGAEEFLCKPIDSGDATELLARLSL